MHPLLEFMGEREHWVCSACRRRCPPVSDNGKQRILEIYPLVVTPANHITPLRAQSHWMLLHVPPVDFGWGASAGASGARAREFGGCARPVLASAGQRVVWKLSPQESDALWLAAKPYEGILFVE